jgi:hypothetical protein
VTGESVAHCRVEMCDGTLGTEIFEDAPLCPRIALIAKSYTRTVNEFKPSATKYSQILRVPGG